MGAKGAPGEACDCSGLVSKVVEAGGEPDPNSGSETSGVLNIENNMQKVDENNVAAGNIVTFHFDQGYPYHTGLLINVVKGPNGEITGFTMIHSSSGVGPNELSVTIGEGKLGNGVFGYYKWDKIPDAKSSEASSKIANPFTNIVNYIDARKEMSMYLRMAGEAKEQKATGRFMMYRQAAQKVYEEKIYGR